MAKITARYLLVDENGGVTFSNDEDKVDEMIEANELGDLMVIDLAESTLYHPDGEDRQIIEHVWDAEEEAEEEEPENEEDEEG